ncbi:hypothetical protein SSX86_018380 [Deinandra increscens subsp. villosa]|uniref:F-box domain-containing protein n=1 Tax=Deinandra increscens subsp. villosa TaxID=3103831 RepID=A0AAP0GW94_9ASTR
MENDDVLYNILARLPGKALLRSRCVSKHWNRLISDPCFMKLRSRRMILLPFSRPLAVFDDNASVKDHADRVVAVRCSPFKQEPWTCVKPCILGTFNGLMILALSDYKLSRCQLILYNPLTTCASSKALVVMNIINRPSSNYTDVSDPYVFGFGDDHDLLKIVIIDCWRHSNRSLYAWDVFDLRTSSWSTQTRYLRKDFWFSNGDAGMFLDGFLYWATTSSSSSSTDDDNGISSGILALDLKEMVFSRIKLPVQLSRHGEVPRLGSKDGCLCMITTLYCTIFDIWVMRKDQGSIWLKVHSFTLSLPDNIRKSFRPVCILGNGKILFTNQFMQLVMYDTSKDSYEMFSDFIGRKEDLREDFKRSSSFSDIRSIEYVESLVSPFDPLMF